MKTLPYKFGGCLLALMGWAQTAANDSVVTSVYSSVSNGYARATLADGSWKPESYVMGNGGFVAGTVANSAGEDVTFPTIVRLVAAHLAKKNYLPAPEAKSADLLLVLSWGKTNPFNDAAQRTNTDGVSTAVNNLNIANDTGLIYHYHMNDFDKAEPYYRKAVEIGKAKGYDCNKGSDPDRGFRDALNNMYKILVAKKRWKDLKEFAEKDVPEAHPLRSMWIKEAEGKSK